MHCIVSTPDWALNGLSTQLVHKVIKWSEEEVKKETGELQTEIKVISGDLLKLESFNY